MAEFADQFEVVGDPDALPDTFFDALAGMLLDNSQAGESEQDATEEPA